MKSESSFDYHIFSSNPTPPKGKAAAFNLIYLSKGNLMCGKRDSYTSVESGELALIPPKTLCDYTTNEKVKSSEAEGICLTIYPSFMKRLSANFPEFADVVSHIQTIKQPTKFLSTQKEQIIKELKEMEEVSNAERIPHLLNILCCL